MFLKAPIELKKIRPFNIEMIGKNPYPLSGVGIGNNKLNSLYGGVKKLFFKFF